jgi:hypothetical protein
MFLGVSDENMGMVLFVFSIIYKEVTIQGELCVLTSVSALFILPFFQQAH